MNSPKLSALSKLRYAVAKKLNVIVELSIGDLTAEGFLKTSFKPNTPAYNLSMEGVRVWEIVIYAPPPNFFDELLTANTRKCAIMKRMVRGQLLINEVLINKLNMQTDGSLYALLVEREL